MRGRYLYFLDGTPAPIDEVFAVERDTWWSERRAGDVVLTVTARLGTDLGVDFGADLGVRHAQVTFASPTVSRTADVSRVDGELRWTVSDRDAEAPGRPPYTAPADAVLFPLLRCFQGAAVRAVASGGAAGRPMVVPDIRPEVVGDPLRVGELLAPRVDRRTALAHDDGSFTYVGGSYESGARCWLRADGLLERYVWDQPGVGTWDVHLEGSPPPSRY